MRRLVPLCLLGAALLAACGSQREAGTTSASQPTVVRPAAPAPDLAAPRHTPAVQVTVVDGDTNALVRGARVTIGSRSAGSDRRGVARVPLVHRSSLVTQVAKPGYTVRSVRLSFRTHPKSTIRIYRRSLQWTMYGANPARSQDQPGLDVRPPFHVVWSRGLGTLIEFPAVVQDGVAYIANARGTVRALDMRNGDVIWRHDTPHGKMAASPAVWGDELIVHGMDGHVWVLRRSDGHLLWHYTVGSPVESSPVIVDGADVFGAWNGTVTALDLRTHHVRWRYDDGCKVTSSVALAGTTLYLGDYCGRLVALQAGTGRLLFARGVGGRVYGTPAVSARTRLRAELHGRLADRVLDERPLPLAPLDRVLRLLVPGSRRRSRLLRLVQRRLLCALGANGQNALGPRHRRTDLRCRRGCRRGRLRRFVRAPHRRGRREKRSGRARLPAR